MAARQRLRTVLDARRASRPCWRCALNLPRHNSSSPAGIPGSSNRSDEVPYSRILQHGLEETLKSHFPDLPVKPAAKILDESESGSSQRVREPRIRLMSGGRRVPLCTRSAFISSAPEKSRRQRLQVQTDDQQVPSGTEPRSKSKKTTEKPRIRVKWKGRLVSLYNYRSRTRHTRVAKDGQQIASGTELHSKLRETTKRPRIARVMTEAQSVPFRTWSEFISSCPREPRIRRIKVQTHDQQVASGMVPPSKSTETTQKPRMRVRLKGRLLSVRNYSFRTRHMQVVKSGQQVASGTKSRVTTQKPCMRVMQDGQTIPVRSLPEFMSFAHRAHIRRNGVLTDRQPEASGTEPQSKSMENIQKPRTRSIQEKSVNQTVTSSTRSQSRRKKAARKPLIRRIRLKSDRQPVVSGIQDMLHFQNGEQSLQSDEPQASHIIPKRVLSNSKRELDQLIRPISTMTLPVSEAPALLEKLSMTDLRKWKVVSKAGLDPVVRTKHTAPFGHDDEASHKELRSVLDVYKDLHTSDWSNTTRETGHVFSSTRFFPQNSVGRRIALSESRTLSRPSLAIPNRLFSSRTRRAPDRQYATATVSKGRLPLVFNPLKPSTESDYAG